MTVRALFAITTCAVLWPVVMFLLYQLALYAVTATMGDRSKHAN